MEHHRSTARVLDILELLAASSEGHTLTEISNFLGMPRSSLFPIIHTLADRNHIYLNPQTMKYSIAVKAYVVGASYLGKNDTYNLVLEEMGHITEKCMEICQLGILDGNEVLYIGKVESPEPIRLISHIGKRLPFYCTALGKALVSQMSYEEIKALCGDSLHKRTPYTITDLQTIYNQILRVRNGELAVDEHETQENVKCFAVPLRANGKVIAAISVSTPIFRSSKEKDEQIKTCLLASRIKLESALEHVLVRQLR